MAVEQPSLSSWCGVKYEVLFGFIYYRCPSGYNLGQYPGSLELVPGVTLETLNTQAAEQWNNILNRIKTQISFMGHDNAFKYTRFFLARVNQLKMEDM